MRALVWELEDRDSDDHAVLSGRFVVELGDGAGEPPEFDDVDAALAYAHGVADVVDVELEAVRCSASGGRDLPPLRPEQLERARLGRRRWPGEEWLDRTELDPPQLFLVTLEVEPPELVGVGEEREAQVRLVDAVEAGLLADGFEDVFASSDELDAGLAEIDRQEAAGGWDGLLEGRVAYVVHGTVSARTWRAAVDLAVLSAAAALTEATGRGPWMHTTFLPVHEAGWGVKAVARPVESPPPRPGPV